MTEDNKLNIGDVVMWCGSNGYLKNSELYVVREISNTGGGYGISKVDEVYTDNYKWRCDISNDTWKLISRAKPNEPEYVYYVDHSETVAKVLKVEISKKLVDNIQYHYDEDGEQTSATSYRYYIKSASGNDVPIIPYSSGYTLDERDAEREAAKYNRAQLDELLETLNEVNEQVAALRASLTLKGLQAGDKVKWRGQSGFLFDVDGIYTVAKAYSDDYGVILDIADSKIGPTDYWSISNFEMP